MLKIIGMIFVIISSSLFGIYLGLKDDWRIKELKEFKKGLKILEGEILYVRNTIDVAMENVSLRVTSPISQIFFDTSLIPDSFDSNIKEIWIKSLENNHKNTSLITSDIEYFKGIGDLLGYLDIDTQKNSIAMYINHIDDEINILNENRVKTKKMYHSLGVLSGLLIIILFI